MRVQAKATNTNSAKKSSADSAARQMLGMKGAALETDLFKIRVQLTKPVTWVPLIWGVVCGAAASGNYVWNDPTDVGQLLLCCMMSGPFLTGYTQVSRVGLAALLDSGGACLSTTSKRRCWASAPLLTYHIHTRASKLHTPLNK